MFGEEVLLVHYSEIALKGGNRAYFERALVRNLKRALPSDSVSGLQRLSGRIVVRLTDRPNKEAILESMGKVFGASWFAFAHLTGASYDEIERTVLTTLASRISNAESFMVRGVRADKGFPLSSMELNTKLGDSIVREFGTKVDLKRPALTIGVEVTKHGCLVFADRQRGLGGLPVGSSGKVLCLMSGGIDSPVAAWLAMKRGASPDYIHFHPFDDNAEAINSKISHLVRLLNAYSDETRCSFVPTYQFSLSTTGVPARYDVVLFRRFMLKCAQRKAEEVNAKALVTGESLAQVASQTLDNMSVIHRATEMPILMPLVAHDKQEIIDLAKKIGTYDISLMPYKDCCSIIARHPETKAKLDIVQRLEAKIGLDNVVDECLRDSKWVRFD